MERSGEAVFPKALDTSIHSVALAQNRRRGEHHHGHGQDHCDQAGNDVDRTTLLGVEEERDGEGRRRSRCHDAGPGMAKHEVELLPAEFS